MGALLGTAFTWLSSYPVDFAIPCVILWALGGVYAELKEPTTSILAEFTTKQLEGTKYGVLAGMILVGVAIVLKIGYIFVKQRPAAVQAAAAAKGEEEHEKTNKSSSD